VARLDKGEQEWEEFYRRRVRGGPASDDPCDSSCRTDILCRLVTFDRTETSECEDLMRKQKEREEKEWEDWEEW
jgi:hypothetical protein